MNDKHIRCPTDTLIWQIGVVESAKHSSPRLLQPHRPLDFGSYDRPHTEHRPASVNYLPAMKHHDIVKTLMENTEKWLNSSQMKELNRTLNKNDFGIHWFLDGTQNGACFLPRGCNSC